MLQLMKSSASDNAVQFVRMAMRHLAGCTTPYYVATEVKLGSLVTMGSVGTVLPVEQLCTREAGPVGTLCKLRCLPIVASSNFN